MGKCDLGFYHLYLLLVIYYCNVVVVNNEVLMVFGGVSPHNVKCQSSNQTNCTSWPFDSLVKQYGISSIDKWIISLITSLQYAGAIFGSLIGGYMADVYGRKVNTVTFFAGNVLVSLLSAFTGSSWITMAICRFGLGICNGGYSASSCVLLMESLREGLRLKAQFFSDIMNSVSFMWISLLAYLIGEWKLLTIVTSVQGLPAIFMFIFIQESPLWLIKKGKIVKAEQVLKRILGWDLCFKVPDPVLVNEELICIVGDPKVGNKDEASSETSYRELFSTRRMAINTLTVVYSMFVTGTAGYFIIFNSGNLVGNIYLNFTLIGSINIVAGVFTVIIEKFFNIGRRTLVQIGLIGVTVGLSIIVVLYLVHAENSFGYLFVASAMIGSAFSFILWPVNTLFATQLFPTNLRNKSSGIAIFGSRVGAVLAPIILYLFDIWKPLPFMVTVFLTSLNSALAFFIFPEPGERLFEGDDSPYQQT